MYVYNIINNILLWYYQSVIVNVTIFFFRQDNTKLLDQL